MKPERFRTPSQRGSIGGRGMHYDAPGLSALMGAPKPYSPKPVTVPLERSGARARSCPYCKARFKSGKAARGHASNCPENPKPFQCVDCGNRFVDVASREAHACARRRQADQQFEQSLRMALQ